MKKICSFFFCVTSSVALSKGSTSKNLDVANKIRTEGFYNSQVMATLEHLTDKIGPRLTGSPQMDTANIWTKENWFPTRWSSA